MYTPGQGGGNTPVVPVVLGASTLPVTGALSNAVQIAVAVAAGLAVWALMYVAQAKFSKR